MNLWQSNNSDQRFREVRIVEDLAGWDHEASRQKRARRFQDRWLSFCPRSHLRQSGGGLAEGPTQIRRRRSCPVGWSRHLSGQIPLLQQGIS